ncbi:MAG: hypothetical protein ABSF09_06185 [Candidatus Bathyarchaeia archaeon]
MSDYFTQLAVGLTFAGISLLCWGWKVEIYQFIKGEPQFFILKSFEQRGFQNSFAIRFEYAVKTSKTSIDGLEARVHAGYGHQSSGLYWANLDLREYEQNEAITGKDGEPVSRLSFLRHDLKHFTLVTFVLTPKEGGIERRAIIRVVDPSKQSRYGDINFGSLYPRIWVRFAGLPEKFEKEYVVVYNDPPWRLVDEAVELLESDSERAKQLIAEHDADVTKRKLAKAKVNSSSQGSSVN